MNDCSYLFYDIESTGLNPCFDQVLQFAAIRTDLNLNEIERHQFEVKLNPDIIPSPYAVMIHGIGIKQMLQGQNEYDTITAIHRLFNRPHTISLGYNTLGFDDEFLRFSFYRNLLTPYTHQYAHGCSRMDIYPMTLLYYLFKPNCLEWPHIDDKVSLKLEHLSRLNQLASGPAHDAMVDVEATLALAKILKKDHTMWDYCCGYFNKAADQKRIHALEHSLCVNQKNYPLAYAVLGRIGANNNFIAPVLSLGTHKVYKNQSLWLRLDNERILSSNKDNILKQSFIFKKKMAEPPIILPVHERYGRKISNERQALATQVQAWLTQHPELLEHLRNEAQYYRYPAVDDIDIDAALYDLPFPSAPEQQGLNQFHQLEVHNKALFIHELNQHHQQLAWRILAKHYPEALESSQLQDFNQHQQQLFGTLDCQMFDYKNQKKLTSLQALAEISKLQQQKLDPEKLNLLNDLSAHLKNKAKP